MNELKEFKMNNHTILDDMMETLVAHRGILLSEANYIVKFLRHCEAEHNLKITSEDEALIETLKNIIKNMELSNEQNN